MLHWTLALIVVAMTNGFSGLATAADKVRIGYPSAGGHFITLPLADKKSFFREQGINAEIVQIRPQAAVPALANGEIDYYAGVGPVVTAAIAGVPVRIVAVYVPAYPIALVARPEYKSVVELKGKPIGIGVLGSNPHMVTRMLLKHFGLDPDRDVKAIPGGSANSRLATLQQGMIAATVVPPPFDFHAQKLGFNILARAQDLLTYPAAGLGTTLKKIKERPDEIKRVIQAGIMANRYLRKEREATIRFLTEWQKINREVAVATYDSVWKAYNEDGAVSNEGMRVVIDEARTSSQVTREIPVSQVADLTVLKLAQTELGISRRD